MSRRKFFLLKFCILFSTTVALLDHQLIQKFCEYKNAKVGTIFSCGNKKENFDDVKHLSTTGLRFLVIDIHYSNIDNVLLNRNFYKFAVIFDESCINSAQNVFKDKKYFYETYHWLVLSSPESKKKNLSFLKKLPLNINSDVSLVTMNATMDKYPILDVYNPAYAHHGYFTATEIGHYSKRGFKTKTKENKYWTRKNMTGVRFKSAIVLPDPRIKLKDLLTSEEHRQLHSMHRFQNVLVDYCRQIYNFSLQIERTNSWGYLTPNGHFDGLVGLLEKRLVDFGSSPLVYKTDRMPVVDYSYGSWILKSTFIYRRPKIVEASHEIFMRPLSKTVWVCIAAMMAVLMLFLKLIFSRESRILRGYNKVDSSWSFLLLFTLGAFCQQGATCYPKLLSSRTLAVFVFLFCILIYQFYSASIVSYLLMDPPRKINNLKDLSDSNLKTGIEDILIDRNYFVQTTDPAAIELFNKKIKGGSNNSGFYDPAQGLEMVKRGGFAFHVETSTAYPIIEETFTNQEICELEEVQMYRTQPMHSNLQKHSPFREMMNYCMLHMVENGIIYRLRKFWDARKPVCIESAKKIDIHVGLKEFSAGPVVLIYGIFTSLLILVAEVVIVKKRAITDFFFKKNVITPYTN